MDCNNRPSTSVEALSNTERLQLSILHGTKTTCKAVEESYQNKITFNKDAISLLSILVWKKLQEMGFDLECFAKHAKYSKQTKKTIIRPRDVLLLARHNSSLMDHLNRLMEKQQERKRKSSNGVSEPQPADAFNAEAESNVESNDAFSKAEKESSRVHPMSDDEDGDNGDFIGIADVLD